MTITEKHNDLTEIKNRSVKGFGALLRRQVVIKILNVISGIILARLLAPEIFGIYAIVLFVVQFFSVFGDVGLGAALIQKKGELDKAELSSTFWLQQVLVWVVVLIVIITAPLAMKVYPSLHYEGVWLIRIMAFSFTISSLKTIPAILMERKLDFNRIAWVDIAENVVFQIAAISFALAGFRVWAFILAAVIRSVVGIVVMYSLSTWRPSLHFELASVKELVRFGLPYQGNSILGFIKDAVTPLFVGAYAGTAAVGYVNWARNFAFAPLMLSESFARVAFPAFSKIQQNKELLGRAVERSMRMITQVMFPITAMMIALGPDITRVVFTDKWMPGIWAFYLYCTSPIIIGVMLPMYSAILALGRSNILLKMMSALLLLEWGMGVPFVILFGFTGIVLNQPITATIFFFIYKDVLRKEGVMLSISKNIKWQLVVSIVLGLVIKAASLQININFFTLIMLFLLGSLGYIMIVYFTKKEMFSELRRYLLQSQGVKGEI